MEYWNSFENLDPLLLQGLPEVLPEVDPNIHTEDPLALSGPQFLYTSHALGLSIEAQDKLWELADGRGLSRAGTGQRLKWASMASLIADLHETRLHDGLFGSKVAEELRAKLPKLAALAAGPDGAERKSGTVGPIR